VQRGARSRSFAAPLAHSRSDAEGRPHELFQSIQAGGYNRGVPENEIELLVQNEVNDANHPIPARTEPFLPFGRK
jgi:hypothetical protein